MIPEILQKSIGKISEVCRSYQVRELSLFGSQARGNFNIDSDFDFLIEFEPTADIDYITFGQIQEKLETIVKKPVDLVPKNGLKKIIRGQILSEAEVIYAA